MQNVRKGKPEIWGGIECTINRVEDIWIDQLELSGHYNREDMLPISELGFKAVRYPVLWERHQFTEDMFPDFTWASSQIEILRQQNITPIIGLVHHGSGPAFTNLLDDGFPEKLALYAGQVASAFPWVKDYTPVNEPFTTARFSGLYGLWYPHKHNDVSCIKMLLNQLKGTVLSMQAIRKINPGARLIQTEDLGKTYSSPLLAYQANFENQRRWLTIDILCGRMVPGHPLWGYFQRLGIPEECLEFFSANPTPPDIIGVNYYVTSERFIDEEMDKYPVNTHGGNSLHRYADTEAVRVKLDQPNGFKVLVKELWDRYKLPIAVTEAHLHCAREEQLKWFLEIYSASEDLIKEGIQINAVTSWALLGSYGWNKLLTGPPYTYEQGAFDVSAGKLRPTAMAGLLKALTAGKEFKVPNFSQPGWWKSAQRFQVKKNMLQSYSRLITPGRPLLIIGKTGTLGRAFARVCQLRGLPFRLVGRDDVDIADYTQVEKIIAAHNPWAIVNAAGFVRVDEAETDQINCYRENSRGPRMLAIACNTFAIKLLTFSSDLVFNGKKNTPYFESDPVSPLNVYGQSKVNAEEYVMEQNPTSLIVRTSAFFGPWDKYNFLSHVLHSLEKGSEFEVASDITISPTYVPHLVNACLDLLVDEERGIFHLANNTGLTWYDWALDIANRVEGDTGLIIPAENILWPATRPAYSVLQSEKGHVLPPLDAAMDEYFETVVTHNL